jgi:hypothetical protein
MDNFSNTVLTSPGTIAVGTTTYVLGKAPADANGGGFMVTELLAVSTGALAAGSAYNVTFITQTSAGVTSGTIGSTGAGSAWSAGTAVTATVSDGWVDGGEYIAAVIAGTAANATSTALSLGYNAIMGRT